MTKQDMENVSDCGPSAVSRATGRTIAEVKAVWPGGWKDRQDIRDDINDWPDDHRLAVEALGMATRTVTLSQILDGSVPVDRTVVLVHFGHMAKHWVVYAGRQGESYGFHWGNGQIRWFPREDVVEMFTRSFPNCAYMVVDYSPERVPWYRRLLGWFARWW